MPLELNTIIFNHDIASVSTSAMNIRRNKDFEVPVPEYDKAIPRPVAQSCAAYAVAETAGRNVIVRVNFRMPSAPAGAAVTYEVKADGGGVMGALDTFQVTFNAGVTSKTADISLSRRNFVEIGRHDVTWQWSYRQMGVAAWQNLAATSHRIYIILAVPADPWTQAAGNKRNPWTDMLDECCVMAAAARDAATATKKIAQRINGGYNLRYDIVSGAPRYGFRNTGDSFNLTNWINYVLKGNAPDNPRFCPGGAEDYKDSWIVNCYDCAASLSLMSKAVGAPIDYYFHQPFGYLKYVVPIGRGKCNNPFYGCRGNNPEVGPDAPRTNFGNHAYTKISGDRNYDATMKSWLSEADKGALLIVWLLIYIFTFGRVNRKDLLERAGGWLVELLQVDYEERTIDKSQPFEAARAAGGAPVQQNLQFRIV